MPIPSVPPLFSAPTHGSHPLSASSTTRNAPTTGSDAARKAAEEFEAFVLQSFVEAMLPREAESVFGRGTAGAFWKSMLAEQLARELTRSGGVGIARLIDTGGAQKAGGNS